LVSANIDLVIQINGKLRGNITVPSNADKKTIEEMAINNENVQKFIGDKAIKKVIIVPNRLVNIVI